jgi:DNA-binding NarL/FixJ family response regulator
LRRLLSERGFEVAGVAGDAVGAVTLATTRRPDVAVIDIRMPPTHTTEGITAAKRIRRDLPRTGVLVLSQYADADYALALMRDQPSRCGYLLKDRVTEIDHLVAAIRRVGAGELVVDPELAQSLVAASARRQGFADLSEREREVLVLLAEGLTDRAIADRLTVTPRTVETHVRHVLLKLGLPDDGLHNRRVLAVLAFLNAR